MGETSALAVVEASLPIVYVEAVKALAECWRVDECKEWADRAAALASYAKQRDDETLLHTAQRIKGRAVRRIGELLAEIPPAKTGPKPVELGEGALPQLETRRETAERVGITPPQVKQALRVAAVPELAFEQAVEADKPATITQLAKLGTKPQSVAHLRGRDPRDYHAATRGMGALRSFATALADVDVSACARGVDIRDVEKALTFVESIRAWLDAFTTALENE